MDDHGNALIGVLYALLIEAVVALLLYILLT